MFWFIHISTLYYSQLVGLSHCTFLKIYAVFKFSFIVMYTNSEKMGSGIRTMSSLSSGTKNKEKREMEVFCILHALFSRTYSRNGNIWSPVQMFSYLKTHFIAFDKFPYRRNKKHTTLFSDQAFLNSVFVIQARKKFLLVFSNLLLSKNIRFYLHNPQFGLRVIEVELENTGAGKIQQ